MDDSHKICYPNLTREEFRQFQQNVTRGLMHVYRLYSGWIPLPGAILSLILTSIYALSIKKAMKKRTISGKCYTFILNRAIGDFFCSTFFIIAAANILMQKDDDELDPTLYTLLEAMCSSCLWTGNISYVSLCILKLYAVWKPLHYKRTFSLKRCVCQIVASWVFFLSVHMTMWGLFICKRLNLEEFWMHIRTSSLVFYITRSSQACFIILYITTICVFLVTGGFLHKQRMFSNSFRSNEKVSKSKKRKKLFPFWKLTLCLWTFVILHFPYFWVCIRVLFYHQECFWQTDRKRKTIIFSIFRVFILARILVDVVVGFITDSQLRSAAHQLFSKKTDNSGTTGVSQSSTNRDGPSEGRNRLLSSTSRTKSLQRTMTFEDELTMETLSF